MKNRYRNPWYRINNILKEEYYTNNAEVVMEYRGVKVYELHGWQHDYVFEGWCVSQMVACKKEFIDELLDGVRPCTTEIKEHLNKHGHKAMSYEDYNKVNVDEQRRIDIATRLGWKRIRRHVETGQLIGNPPNGTLNDSVIPEYEKE